MKATIQPRPQSFQWVRIAGIMRRYGFKSRGSVYNRIADGLLPELIRLGPNVVAAPDFELDAIDAARLQGAADDDVRTLVGELVAARRAAA